MVGPDALQTPKQRRPAVTELWPEFVALITAEGSHESRIARLRMLMRESPESLERRLIAQSDALFAEPVCDPRQAPEPDDDPDTVWTRGDEVIRRARASLMIRLRGIPDLRSLLLEEANAELVFEFLLGAIARVPRIANLRGAFEFAAELADRVPRSAGVGLTPAQRFAVFGEEFSLPVDIAQMTPLELSQEIERNVGESIATLESRMRPKRLALSGFLGEDERLVDVILRDAKRLAELGITFREVGQRMDALLRLAVCATAVNFLDDVEERWRLAESLEAAALSRQQVEEMWNLKGTWGALGRQQDPFLPADTRHTFGGSMEVRVTNRATGRNIFFGGIQPAMVRRCCFFEGSVAPYGLDVNAVVDVLALQGQGAMGGGSEGCAD